MDQQETRRPPVKLNNPVRFGSFSLNPETGELRKHGVLVRLQGKPFQILTALLEKPGSVVTRTELRQRLWSADKTFVDFENGLNTAVNRLRAALGDSAEKPTYVETLSRLGYRFIAPVENGGEAIPATLSAASGTNGSVNGLTKQSAEIDPRTQAIGAAAPVESPSSRRPVAWVALAAAALAVVGIGLYRTRQTSPPSFHQITFHKGLLGDARFVPNGQGIAYSAEWNAAPSRLFVSEKDNATARDLGLSDIWFAGFPSTSKVAFFTSPSSDSGLVGLESTTLSGNTRQRLTNNAYSADWSRDGRLSVIKFENSLYSVEFPLGHKIYSSPHALTNLRISPGADYLAFTEHPIPHDDAGKVMLFSLSSGAASILSPGWESLEGLAWAPSGKEVWFTAAREGTERQLYAADLQANLRSVAQMPGGMQLRDISPSGNVLINRSSQRMKMVLADIDHDSTQDISWLDWSSAKELSADGKFVLFDESGTGGGTGYSVFLLEIGKSTPVRLSSGRAMALSSDARWALTESADDPTRLARVSTGEKVTDSVSYPGFSYRWVKFLPGNKEILFAGEKQGQSPGLYRQRLPVEQPERIIDNTRMEEPVLDSSGTLAAVLQGCDMLILNLRDRSKRLLKLPNPAEPVLFAKNGMLLISRKERDAFSLSLLDLHTGHTRPYKRVSLGDATGMGGVHRVHVSPDLHTAVFSRVQSLADLFVVSGWR